MSKLIAALSLYEFAAIASSRVPTLSALIRKTYAHPLGRPVLWLGWGWLTAHFFDRGFARAVVASEQAGL